MAVLALWPGYCYSDGIVPYYGSTGNAVTDQSLRWSMDNVLPEPPGLDINGVIYNYTIRKETEDSVDVSVSNENVDGTGYIFRETDSWLPGSLDGTQISKIVPTLPLNRELWGDGSIDVEGPGSVEDASVSYSYRVDPCYDPQFSAACPGYEPPEVDTYSLDYEPYDATQHANYDEVEDRYSDEESESEEDRSDRESEEDRDRRERLEKALAAIDNSMLFANALAASQALSATALSLQTYENKTIFGGIYTDNIVLKDSQLPDSGLGARNGLAQQLLHKQMVNSQYD